MKTIIITGASEGLGLELFEKFSTEGWKVVGISRHIKDQNQTNYIIGDLTYEKDLERISAEIKTKYSDFSILVNCAGMLNVEKLSELDYKKTEMLFKLNVIAPMMLVSRLKDCITVNNADIVNVGSTVGFKAYEEQAAYGSSKWAVRGLNENLRLEFKGTKVRVIGFNPGGFQSKLFEKATGGKVDLSTFMNPKYLAEAIFYITSLPKDIEVSEITINRK